MLRVLIRMLMYVIFTLTDKKYIRQRDLNKGIVPLAPGHSYQKNMRIGSVFPRLSMRFLINQFQQ